VILQDLATLLQSASVATMGTDLFAGRMPPHPDRVLSLYEYAGFAPLETLGAAGMALDRPSVQMIARGGRGNYPEAHALLIAARDVLIGVVDTSTNGGRLLRVRAAGSITTLGEDDNERPRLSLSLDVVAEP
jgi:hypothetical protein